MAVRRVAANAEEVGVGDLVEEDGRVGQHLVALRRAEVLVDAAEPVRIDGVKRRDIDLCTDRNQRSKSSAAYDLPHNSMTRRAVPRHQSRPLMPSAPPKHGLERHRSLYACLKAGFISLVDGGFSSCAQTAAST